MAEQERPFLEEILDFALYAPVGLALTVAEDLPQIIERGRRRISGQVGVAKFMGRIALRSAQRRLDDLLEPRGGAGAPKRTGATVTVLADVRESSRPGQSTDKATAVAPPDEAVAASVEELAIPGYDSLAASQVVARLDALSLEELAEVERHELAGRKRRTILTRISQLKG